MKSVSILLKEAQNIKSLVSIINKYPYDIDLRSGRYVVDAKSILGIFSLDLSKPINLNIHAEENMEDILKVLAPYII